MLALIAVFSFLLVIHAQVPVPTRPIGFIYNRNSSEAAVEIEVHIDPGCPGSKAAFPVIKSVSDFYNASQVRVKFVLFPLPYHRNAFIASVAALVAYGNPPKGKTNDSAALDFIQKCFDNIVAWSDSKTYTLGQDKVESMIAGYSGDLGYNTTVFLKALQSSTYGWNARVMWKYSCTKGASATPWIFINGIHADAAEWVLADWKKAIDNLLAGNNIVV